MNESDRYLFTHPGPAHQSHAPARSSGDIIGLPMKHSKARGQDSVKEWTIRCGTYQIVFAIAIPQDPMSGFSCDIAKALPWNLPKIQQKRGVGKNGQRAPLLRRGTSPTTSRMFLRCDIVRICARGFVV
jgi:hypothetical protein